MHGPLKSRPERKLVSPGHALRKRLAERDELREFEAWLRTQPLMYQEPWFKARELERAC